LKATNHNNTDAGQTTNQSTERKQPLTDHNQSTNQSNESQPNNQSLAKKNFCCKAKTFLA